MELRPSEAAVLIAISRGIDTVDAIARALNASREAIEEVVAELKAKGLVEEKIEGRLIKRRRLQLTRRGLDALGEAEKRLEEVAEAYRHYRDRRELPPGWAWGVDEFLLAVPLLTLLGIVPATEMMTLLALLEGLEEQDSLEETVENHDYEEGLESYEDEEELADDWGLDD